MRFKGKLRFQIIVKKMPDEKSDDILMVRSYELGNFMKFEFDEATNEF